MEVEYVETVAAETPVYNLTVADFHDYFASDNMVLVHNVGCGGGLKLADDTIHGHHTYPKALGGHTDQPLAYVKGSLHAGSGGIHSDLGKFEEGWLKPTRGYTGAQIIATHGSAEIEAGLRRFYQQEKHRHLLPAFEKAVKYTKKMRKRG